MAALLEGLAGGLAGAAKGIGGIADAEIKRRDLAAKAKTEMDRLEAQFQNDLKVAGIKHGYRASEQAASDKAAMARRRAQDEAAMARRRYDVANRAPEKPDAFTDASGRRMIQRPSGEVVPAYESVPFVRDVGTEHPLLQTETMRRQVYSKEKEVKPALQFVPNEMGGATVFDKNTRTVIGTIDQNGNYIQRGGAPGQGGAPTVNDVTRVYKAPDGRFVGVTPMGPFFMTAQQARAVQARIGNRGGGNGSAYPVPPPPAPAPAAAPQPSQPPARPAATGRPGLLERAKPTAAQANAPSAAPTPEHVREIGVQLAALRRSRGIIAGISSEIRSGFWLNSSFDDILRRAIAGDRNAIKSIQDNVLSLTDENATKANDAGIINLLDGAR